MMQGMVIDMNDAQLQTLDQVRAFLKGTAPLGFSVATDERYEFVTRTVRRFGYSRLNRADKRPFSKNELRAYWQLLRDRPGNEAAVLRLHLLTGGQRIEQFVRLRWVNVTDDALTIFDGKGRPGQGPRPHQIPLLESAREALARQVTPRPAGPR